MNKRKRAAPPKNFSLHDNFLVLLLLFRKFFFRALAEDTFHACMHPMYRTLTHVTDIR